MNLRIDSSKIPSVLGEPTSRKSTFKDLCGTRFGRLTAIYPIRKKGKIHWSCVCSCSQVLEIPAGNLANGNSKSCGCARLENLVDRSTTHSKSKIPEYAVWSAMKARCTNPNNRSYKNYGARGISFCERWSKFENFIEDMGRRPSDSHSLDRVGNGTEYSKDNCRWATTEEQANNKRSNRYITFKNSTLTLAQWSRETGISSGNIKCRIDELGWSVDKALSTPTRKTRKSV